MKTEEWVKFGIIFKGTPAEFASMVRSYSSEIFDTHGRPFFVYDLVPPQVILAPLHNSRTGNDFRDELTAENPTRYSDFLALSNYVDWESDVKAESLPDGNVLLVVKAKKESWPKVEESWELLYTEMKRLGWVETDGVKYWAEDFEEEQQKLPGGRPPIKEDDWAYEQVVTHRRSPKDVYPEWLIKIGDRANSLADQYASFKQAIRNRRNKKEKGKK